MSLLGGGGLAPSSGRMPDFFTRGASALRRSASPLRPADLGGIIIIIIVIIIIAIIIIMITIIIIIITIILIT